MDTGAFVVDQLMFWNYMTRREASFFMWILLF